MFVFLKSLVTGIVFLFVIILLLVEMTGMNEAGVWYRRPMPKEKKEETK